MEGQRVGVGGGECMHMERKKERKNTPPSARPASERRCRPGDHWRLSFSCEVDGRMALLTADSPYPACDLPV
jgi:hypothetical protein